MARRLLAVSLLTLALLAPTTTRADEPEKATSTADLARAKRVFDAGGRSYDQGDYAAALQSFEQAYAIAPRPNILFSMAQAHRRQFVLTNERAHKEQAITLYRRFIASGATGKRKGEATKALEDLGPLLPNPESATPEPAPTPAPAPVKKTILSIDSPTEGAMISVDGGPPAPPQVNAEVSPGRHVVKVTAPGYSDREVSVQALPFEVVPETVELEEKPGELRIEAPSGSSLYVDGRLYGDVRSLKVAPGSHFVSVAIAGRVSEGRTVSLGRGERAVVRFDPPISGQRIASFALLAGGGLGVAAAAIALGVSAERASSASAIDEARENGSITEAQYDEYEALRSEALDIRTAALAAGGVGIAVTALGLVLYVSDRPSPLAPERGRTEPRPNGSPVRDTPELEMRLLPFVGPDAIGLVGFGVF